MKINKICILLAMAAMTLQSCYKDDEKIFDDSSSVRMTAALNAARDMLTSSEHGWVFEMYPDETQQYGGFVYTARFDKEDHVYVSSERGKSGKVVSSLYKLTNDCGPVLTFDSYNELIHEFATPSDVAYQGKKGEFEFMVMEVTENIIKLKGKKTANVMYMYRLKEPAADYLKKVADINDKLVLAGTEGTVEGKAVKTTIDLDNRQMKINIGEESLGKVAYCITDEGLRLFKDIDIAGHAVKNFKVNFDDMGATKEFTSDDIPGMTLAARFPDGWQPAGVFNGDFSATLLKNYNDTDPTDVPVSIIPEGDGSTFWLAGLSENFDLKMTYSKALGTLSLCTQLLYEKDHKTLARVEVSGTKYYLGLCPFALPKGASSGSIGYSKDYGLTTKYTPTETETRFSLVDNGKWSGKKTTCLRIYCFSGTTMSSTTRKSTVSIPASHRFFQNSSTLYYLEALTKK